MSKGPIRRAQLIAPFGVGSMIVVRDGLSLISCGLDHWYERESKSGSIQTKEYEVEEWRLQRQLGVSHFRLPPDHRVHRSGEQVPNAGLKIPFLRFPQWHFCPGCHLLSEHPLNVAQRFIKCTECEANNRTKFLAQVPFVAMCEGGHLQDFPWREWVHRTATPSCNKSMRLKATGEASLAGQEVSCECGQKRTLASITEGARGKDTFLTTNLDKTKLRYKCEGRKPWHSLEDGEDCELPLKGTLRSASNVYYAKVSSAIYLPRGDSNSVSEIVGLLERPPLSSLIKMFRDLDKRMKSTELREQQGELLQPFTDQDIDQALKIIYDGVTAGTDSLGTPVPGDDPETAFRRSEFGVLRAPRDESQLLIRGTSHSEFDHAFAGHFSNVTLVNKLRETRALTGFTRIFSENQQSRDELLSHLWRDLPTGADKWLPAYIVFGEGIFLELDSKKLSAWEARPTVIDRVAPLVERVESQRRDRGLSTRVLNPRFVLLHTFAHVLMNRLVFECGYSSASLRERIYCSTNSMGSMAGVLIYTAAGDSEGTMGGLVRMGKPGYLENVVRRALEEAAWCSADPVCMEMGEQGGQGPESVNLAACHNCALLPETACEEFNRYLDRATLIGTIQDESIGFFSELS